VATLDFGRVNPVTGPIWIEGAQPGDTLVVNILEFEPSGWGWTAIIPGFGLLSEDFPEPFLQVSEYDASHIEFAPGIRLPVRPFPGTIGVAPKEPGTHSVVPPRRVGGNLDIRDLIEGATLYLPVEAEVPFSPSVTPTHARATAKSAKPQSRAL
jgi:acetamidase/formamidase